MAPGHPDLLRTEGLCKSFGEVRAVDGVDLELKEGALTAVIGPNGAGKTTFINLLSGNLLPDAGRIFFQGEEITRLPVHQRVRRGLGRSFQITNVFPQLEVYRNIQLPLLSHIKSAWRFWKKVDAVGGLSQRMEMVLAEIGLEEKAHLPACVLSHGDQRLLEVGIALAAEPRLILLDEPTAGMNPIERVRVLRLISDLSTARRTTFVLIEHDMDVVFSLADEIVVLHQGQILARGTPSAIREDARVRDVYLGGEIA
jgi:branched-chain amino acid transport system ATP-binding protein